MLERSGFVGIRVFGHLDDPALTEIREFFDKNNQPRPEAVVLGRPPEGADYVRLPPLGAWSWSGPSFLPGTGRGFSVDDDFQAYPLSCESLPKP